MPCNGYDGAGYRRNYSLLPQEISLGKYRHPCFYGLERTVEPSADQLLSVDYDSRAGCGLTKEDKVYDRRVKYKY